jgi:hypothetical protein
MKLNCQEYLINKLVAKFTIGINWILNKITKQTIDLSVKNPEDLIHIEKSFQLGNKMLYFNCSDIDSTLAPLVYYKNSMNHSTKLSEGKTKEIFTNLIY